MKAYRCRFPNCGNLISEPGYCPKHLQYAPPSDSERWKKAKRTNTPLYKTARWRQMQKNTVALYPYCAICGAREKLQVHHKIAPRGNEQLFFDVTNLMVVCADCHRALTRQEIIERGKR